MEVSTPLLSHHGWLILPHLHLTYSLLFLTVHQQHSWHYILRMEALSVFACVWVYVVVYLQVRNYVCTPGKDCKNKPGGHTAAALPFIFKHQHTKTSTHVHKAFVCLCVAVHVFIDMFASLPLASLYSSQILLTATRPSCSSLPPEGEGDTQRD